MQFFIDPLPGTGRLDAPPRAGHAGGNDKGEASARVLETDFILRYLPFRSVNYALAIVVRCCLGRFLFSLFMPRMQPRNYTRLAFYPVLVANGLAPGLGVAACLRMRNTG